MTQSITFEDWVTVVLVWVDDGYQAYGARRFQNQPGAQPVFSHSEVMTLLLWMDFLPFAGETQFLGFMRAQYLDLFPRRLSQSQFNRRARRWAGLVEIMRRDWIRQLGVPQASRYLLDTKPLPVVGYKRSKKRSDFVATADYGVCPSRHMKYFGYKLVLLCTLEGVPVVYARVPASTPERVAAEEVLDCVWHAPIIADKGFIGADWQRGYRETRHLAILTPVRSNQRPVRSPREQARLNGARERIASTFHELQNTGRHRERLLRKTLDGLITHVIAQMTCHTLKWLLRHKAGIDVRTFTATA